MRKEGKKWPNRIVVLVKEFLFLYEDEKNVMENCLMIHLADCQV